MLRFVIAGVGFALLVSVPSRAPARQRPHTEREKIEALIKHVEGLQDARFVRNGTEYGARDAARFLRAKWEAGTANVRTAKDFVEKVASVSSTTGMPYLIRLKGGKEMKGRDYLLAELKKLETPPTGAKPGP
jgi:hypothetical protein